MEEVRRCCRWFRQAGVGPIGTIQQLAMCVLLFFLLCFFGLGEHVYPLINQHVLEERCLRTSVYWVALS